MAKSKTTPKADSVLIKGAKGAATLAENLARSVLGLPKTLTRDQAVAWIKKNTKGKIFGCNFVKRTTGTLRVMTCRYGVRSRAKGVGLSFDPTAYRLIVVFDMVKNEYRMIAIEGIQGLLIEGRYHKVR